MRPQILDLGYAAAGVIVWKGGQRTKKGAYIRISPPPRLLAGRKLVVPFSSDVD